MAGLAQRRLAEERKTWRKEKPFGFTAKPVKKTDGSLDLLKWECIIPGKEKTDWTGGFFNLTLEFPEDYPSKPPKCKFPQGFYHPNVYPSGTVCLSIINEDEGWRPSITVKQVLTGIQELLDTPNTDSPAQSDAYLDMIKAPDVYRDKVRRQTAKYPMR